MASIGDSDNILLNISPDEVNDFLGEYTWEERWENVIMLYYKFPEQAHTAIVSDSDGTALHVAISLCEETVVKELVNAILTHRVEISDQRKRVEALEMENERGDTPLHLAASRGFARICKYIIGGNNERIYLLSRKNKQGETPLFHAAMNWRKQAFAYLAHISKDIVTLQDLVRNDGNSILHTAIEGEYLDLAVIIVHYYNFLSTHLNREESTPLKVLATRPSAFKSTSNLSWYKRILYHCILVEPLDAERTMRSNLRKMEAHQDCNKIAENSRALYDFFSIWLELKDVMIAKKKHQWSSQLLKALMERPYAAFMGTGGPPTDRENDPDMYNIFTLRGQGIHGAGWFEFEDDEHEPDIIKETSLTYEKETTITKETAFLVAARNGIVEVVKEILIKIPSAIHNKNSGKENVLLVAVKYRQPLILETLRDIQHLKPELWNNLILAMDEDENTVLHFAAEGLGSDIPWRIAGSTFQMMWDIKWFQYVKSIAPPHFYFKGNNNGKTPGEIFKISHTDLIQDSGDWLKETSKSCSAVAGLVAGVSFATVCVVPGGTTHEGRPILEGKPAFDVFANSSLIGLCFSITGIIMFLSIITSRKQAKDFSRNLPFKLLIGLSSLFVSITSMFVSFCTGHFFLLSNNFRPILFPIYATTCLPITFYAVAQFPLYFDLLTAILTKVPMPIGKGGG